MNETLPPNLQRIWTELDSGWSVWARQRAAIRRRRAQRGLSAALAAGIAAAFIAVVGIGGRSPTSAVARAAAAAMSPPPGVEHVVTETWSPLGGGKLGDVQEQSWRSADGSGWRTLSSDPTSGLPVDEGVTDGAVSVFDPRANVVYERTTTDWIQDSTSDFVDARHALVSGAAHDTGIVLAGGRRVHRITWADASESCVYDVDPSTFLPVSLQCNNSAGTTWVRGRSTYEFLPPTSASQASLSVAAQHPAARVDRRDLRPCSEEPAYSSGSPWNPPCDSGARG